MIHTRHCPHCHGAWETYSDENRFEMYAETKGYQIGMMTNLGMTAKCYHCGSVLKFIRNMVTITPPNGEAYSKKLEDK